MDARDAVALEWGLLRARIGTVDTGGGKWIGARRERAHRTTGTAHAPISPKGTPAMTFIWFIVWFIANLVGTREPLLFDPVNAWTGTLILAIALDLSAAHAGNTARRRG